MLCHDRYVAMTWHVVYFRPICFFSCLQSLYTCIVVGQFELRLIGKYNASTVSLNLPIWHAWPNLQQYQGFAYDTKHFAHISGVISGNLLGPPGDIPGQPDHVIRKRVTAGYVQSRTFGCPGLSLIMVPGWVSSSHQGPGWVSSLHHGTWLGLITSWGFHHLIRGLTRYHHCIIMLSHWVSWIMFLLDYWVC